MAASRKFLHFFVKTLTLTRIKNLLNSAIKAVDNYEQNHSAATVSFVQDATDFDYDDQNIDFLAQGQKLNVNLADIDYKTWRRQMEADLAVLQYLETLANQIQPERDAKLQSILPAAQVHYAIPFAVWMNLNCCIF